MLLAAVLIFAATQATRVEGSPPAMPSPAEITEFVRSALPAGATVLQTNAAVVPPGWQSPDASAVTVLVNDRGTARSLSFVPLDWIGVQNRGAAGEPVHFGSNAKVIVSGGSTADLPWLGTIAPHSASLASTSGTTAFHVGEYPQAEVAVRTFLRKSGIPREQVAASIIALGVPAEDLIRETALDARSPARLAAIRSLRHFPGKTTREALLKIIADRSKEPAADQCRLAALDTCEHLLIDGHGPAVLAALQAEKDEAVAARLADELNRLRFAPASADLRRWLKSAHSLDTKVSFARALATLRDAGAVAEIQAALGAPAGRRAAVAKPTDGPARRQLQIELQRLAGSWGPQQDGVRLAVTMESPDRVLVHVENMGICPYRFIPVTTASGLSWPIGLEITIDGQTVSPPGPGDIDLGRIADVSRAIAPSSAACFELNLAGPLPQGSDLTVRATWFGLVANELTLRAGTAIAAQAAPAS